MKELKNFHAVIKPLLGVCNKQGRGGALSKTERDFNTYQGNRISFFTVEPLSVKHQDPALIFANILMSLYIMLRNTIVLLRIELECCNIERVDLQN